MELSLFYFAFIMHILLSAADSTEFDSQSPTSRRLLLFGGTDVAKGEKKSHHISSSSKISPPLPSSPPKYARASDSRSLIVYIRPQTLTERGHKRRSYTHLLTGKNKPNKIKIKRSTTEKKKQSKSKKDSTQQKSAITTKTQELVAINDEELNRCRALLHIDSTPKTNDKKVKKIKKDKSSKQEISSKMKDISTQTTKNMEKKIDTAITNAPINEKKIKTTKTTKEINPDEKKMSKIIDSKPSENRPPTSSIDDTPIKTSSSQSAINIKSKREKPQAIPIVEETMNLFNTIEDEIENKNNSMVNRAFHFVKNMFQLSDDSLNDDHTHDNRILDIINEQQQQQQQHHHHSRKLLTIDDNIEIPISSYNNTNVNHEYDLYLSNEHLIETPDDDLSFLVTSISKRQLLSVKTNKHATAAAATTTPKASNNKEKKVKSTTYTDATKPKVGWAYRYRISRYLNAEKHKRSGNKNKIPSGEKTKHTKQQEQQSNSKQNHKRTSSSNDVKVSKRKLLEYNNNNNDDDSSRKIDDISDRDIVNSVLITEQFIPKRQLLSSKTKIQVVVEEDDDDTDDEDELDKANARRQMKSYEELTDPVAIVNSYDQGLFKPRVGWQFRYRVSRYIDALRENIREDQARLKLGLQAIKRKTPQELSGRRKRVLDKPFEPDTDKSNEQEEAGTGVQENKPNVGWRYRYRVSKMDEAKQRGDFIDDEEEKRKARREQKTKQTDHNKPQHDDHGEGIEGEDDLDPELRKISAEGRRVGWAYRYRIRRKLDHLKDRQAELGIPFDIVTLGGKREKKVIDAKVKATEKKTIEPVEQKTDDKKKSVGWEYRYRVSKMREAQKGGKAKVLKSKKVDKIPVDEQMDPELARLKPQQRAVGWKYRYRIRRKLDAMKNAAVDEIPSGKRTKKSASKRKSKEKIIKKVEESLEKILNIDDIDETPFMEYFRRGSSYLLCGLIPTAKKSICLLPLPVTLSFCNEDDNDQTPSKIIGKKSKKSSKKRLKTKKEQRAKQFIHARVTKLGFDDKATERRVDETMKRLYKKPSLPPIQTPPSPPADDEKTSKKQHISLPKRENDDESEIRVIGEEHTMKKQIGVDSKKSKNKKQFQLIGKEVKVKNKHASSSTTVTTPTPPAEETLTTTSSPPRLRSIAEVIQEEASTILDTKRSSSRTPDEIKAQIDETNEIVQERTKVKQTTTQSTPIGSTASEDEDEDSKITGENLEQSVHDVLEVDKDKDSA